VGTSLSAAVAEHGAAAGPACRICGGGDLTAFDAREMMFGLRDRFRYLECRSCGCVQIARYPDTLSAYYPSGYCAFQAEPARPEEAPPTLAQTLLSSAKAALMAASATARRRYWEAASTRAWLATRRTPAASLYPKHVPNPRSRILDVGCGTGALLHDLYYLYYRNIHGIDPFIDADIHFHGRLLVRKSTLFGVQPAYDCISFHHVLEHMPDQLAVLRQAHRLLAPGGIVMVRIPVAGGFAWRNYRENWVQLDPPRHLYVHSERSFTLLAQRAGFDVAIEYDSTGVQFWGSELYLRDIPLTGAGSPWGSGPSIFSAEKRADYERRAEALNAARDGDQIVAILRKR